MKEYNTTEIIITKHGNYEPGDKKILTLEEAKKLNEDGLISISFEDFINTLKKLIEQGVIVIDCKNIEKLKIEKKKNGNIDEEKIIFIRGFNYFYPGDIITVSLDELDKLENMGVFAIKYNTFIRTLKGAYKKGNISC